MSSLGKLFFKQMISRSFFLILIAIISLFFVLISGPVPVFAQTDSSAGSNNAVRAADISQCHVKGIKRWVKCAYLQVPLDHQNPSAGLIDTFAVVVPATSGKPEEDPLVIFAGGPGQSASEAVFILYSGFSGILNKRDIILIDQRGTGRSSPLACDFDDDVISMQDQREAVTACLASVQNDTRQFNLENSVHDFAHMIKALGYAKVNIYGISYGTRTAAHFYRRYADMVRSIIIDGVAPPDYSINLKGPEAADAAFESILTDCARSLECSKAYPDLRQSLDIYLSAARNGELRYQGSHPLTGEAVDMAISEISAVESVRNALYSITSTAFLPYTITEAAKGNVKPIFSQFFSSMDQGKMYLGMTLSFLCAEDIAKISPQEALEWGKKSFAQDTFYRNFANLCSVWPHADPNSLPDDLDAPWTGDVPLIALSGMYDPITPVSGGDHVVKTLENARHIIVPAAGHGVFSTKCVPYLMNKFIEDIKPDDLDISCLDGIKRPLFVIGSNGQTGNADPVYSKSR